MSEDLRGGPNDPASARIDIEQTRRRMSGTLDQIEDVILRKKEQLEEKKAGIKRQLDLGARVRERPLVAAGVVLGAGFLFGFLTGGGSRKDVRSARRKGAKWEKRARRLLEIAQSQEAELEAVRAVDDYSDSYDFDDDFLLDDQDTDYDYLTGEELYPLDPEFDDDTIEYRPARMDRGQSWRDRLYEFAADAVDSVLDSIQARR